MSAKKDFFGDLGKLSSNAAGVLFESGKQVKTKIYDQIKSVLQDMDVVTREEFEVVKEMAQKTRLENEALKKEIEALQGKKKPATKVKAKKAATSPASSAKKKVAVKKVAEPKKDTKKPVAKPVEAKAEDNK